MTWAAASAVTLAGAVWVIRPDDRWMMRRRLAVPAGSVAGGRALAATFAAGIFVVMVMVPSTVTRLCVVVCAGAAWFGLRLHRAAAARAAARDFSAEVARLVRDLSAELRAGVTTIAAFRAVVADASDAWRPLRDLPGSDVPTALRRLGDRPGGSSLIDAAAAWEIADRTGAPLAGLLERVADHIQEGVDVDREIALEAAPARSTGKLMAMLPVLGLVLGTTLGAQPVHVLFGTVPGLACLSFGLLLSCVGLWWIDRIVVAVERV